MGFVSIFGIAVQDALLMVTYFQQLRLRGIPSLAAREAAEKRFRPVLMTTLVATLGPVAGGALARHRLADAEAAGDRGHRRNPSSSPSSPDCFSPPSSWWPTAGTTRRMAKKKRQAEDRRRRGLGWGARYPGVKPRGRPRGRSP